MEDAADSGEPPFEFVTWHLSPDAAGKVFGLKPVSIFKTECSVSFKDNQFLVDGTALAGSLVTTDLTFDPNDRSIDPGNRVTVSLIGCSYPEPFGRSAAMPIAFARERGIWTVALQDLGDRNRDTAIRKGPAPEIVVNFI
jgi:hypothetical protein